MVEDKRLFSANGPIGRLWYFINLGLVICLAFAFYYAAKHYILPAVTDAYYIPVQGMFYFIMFIFAVTFLAVIHRRIYDICGTKDASGYRTISRITWFTVLLYLAEAFSKLTGKPLPAGFDLVILVFSAVFAAAIVIIGFIPGKSVSYSEDDM